MAVFQVAVFVMSLVLIGRSAEATPKVCPPEISSCPPGMRLDTKHVQGCSETVCVNASCPYFKCVPCEYGYKLNDDGCVGCSCKSPRDDVPQNQCGEKVTWCASNMKMDCKFVMDCFDCDCVPENCPLVSCTSSCDYGYKIMEDTGCRGCDCKSGAASVVSIPIVAVKIMPFLVLLLTTVLQ